MSCEWLSDESEQAGAAEEPAEAATQSLLSRLIESIGGLEVTKRLEWISILQRLEAVLAQLPSLTEVIARLLAATAVMAVVVVMAVAATEILSDVRETHRYLLCHEH
jgi:hypothetical protein